MDAVQELEDGSVRIGLDQTIYPLEAVFRSCYLFTDRCYVHLSRDDEEANCISVRIWTKDLKTTSEVHAKEFCNDLIDQYLRRQIADESGKIRELLVAQAFAEGDLIRPDGDRGDAQLGPSASGDGNV